MQTSMLLVGFELTTPVFELAKTVHALDRSATVIDRSEHLICPNYISAELTIIRSS
jgi:hypothetical protein